jgi:rod shape-determining protein MreC
VLLALLILNLPSKTTARIKLGIGSLFVPLFGLANSAQQVSSRAGEAVLPRSQLLRELEMLRRQNQELQLRNAQAEAVARENERLRQLFDWQRKQPHKYKLGNVVLQDPANWWRSVHIDLGSRDGISLNMPVLTTEGLVGRIASVSLTRSQVVLLGDPNCKVAVRVENPTRDSGVVGPAGPLNREFVELGFLSRSANLKPGQIVRTSGAGGVFPKDILVGTVVDSRPVEYGLSTSALVKLAANLNALEEVWVMVD